MVSVKKGDWVQIENIILPAGQRAPQVPADTQACDLKLWVKGIAQQNGEMGDEIEIKELSIDHFVPRSRKAFFAM